MDKKLKMKIAVAVVVILIVVGTLFYLMLPRGESGKTYIYEIEFEVSENETAWIIDIKEITLETSEKKYIFIPVREKIHHTNISVIELDLIIDGFEIKNVGKLSWEAEYYLSNYGVEREQTGEKDYRYLDEGDRIIIWKNGGEDYTPEKGDMVYFTSIYRWESGGLIVRSNKVELP